MKTLVSLIILEKANNRPEQWRFGQAVFNYAYDMYKMETNKLRGTNYDCFYNDSKVEIFLEKLEELLAEFKTQ